MRIGPVLSLTLLARLASAQSTDTTQRLPAVTVSGVVRDSIARTALAGAIVQLAAVDTLRAHVRTTVAEARTAVSDSLGRFAFAGVAPGRYEIGFFHPLLDSLGIESGVREFQLDGRRAARVDLAVPSAATIRAAICGPRSVAQSDAVVIGFVREARDGTPAANARVTGEWLEISIRRGGFDRRVPRLSATTGERGWFALCDVPSPGTILIAATRGADSTDLIEVDVPANGLVRRELYLGSARTIVAIDTITAATRRLHAGDGQLSGIVVTAGGQPLVGARVGIPDGPQTRTNDRGEWTLVDAPAGTRMLEVRALGYVPDRRAVDVRDGAAPVRVVLSTMEAVLDTVKINATRLASRQLATFEQHRRTGAGHYLTADEIARRRPVFTSDLFRAMPGVRYEGGNSADQHGASPILVRGGAAGWCAPSIYIDGQYVSELSGEDLDAFVQPSEIRGIEVYPDATAPAEFQHSMNGCGSILVWTDIDSAADRPKLTKTRLLTGAAVALVGVLVTLLVSPK